LSILFENSILKKVKLRGASLCCEVRREDRQMINPNSLDIVATTL
jgi:hypothetical protein